MGTKGERCLSLPEVVVGLGMKHRSPASAVRPSINFLGPMTFLGLERNYIGN